MQIVEGELTFRSAEDRDAVQLTNWWNDGNVMAHAGFPNGLGQSVETTLQQTAHNQQAISDLCLIEVDGIPVGEMNYRLRGQEAEIGIKICEPKFQNRGYGSRFLQMLIDFLFTQVRINQSQRVEKIVLDTNLNNLRAQHVYEKLGFVKTAIQHNAWQNQLGEWQSSVVYEKNRTALAEGSQKGY